jgi:hypothetical protein
MEIKREVLTEKAKETEADWSAGLISTLDLPEFTDKELDHLSRDQPVPDAEQEEADQVALAGGLGLIGQIAGRLLGR